MDPSISADQIAQSLIDEVVRDRLIERLDERWRSTLTLIEAPGGYGKTRLLAQSVRNNEVDPVGIDVYVRLRIGHGDLAAFTADVTEALGHRSEHADVGGAVDAVVGAIVRRAPSQICLLLDDVHLIADADEVTSFLGQLARAMPANGHLLLAGRRIPELPVARLVADDDVLQIDEQELRFTDAELDALAGAHGADRSLLDSLSGWPALVRLALVAGVAGPQDFLMQEIVGELAPDVRAGLEIATLAGFADDDLFERCGLSMRADELAALVPLTDLTDQGEVRPHELWSESLDPTTVSPARVETIARWHGHNRRHDEAISRALTHGSDSLGRELLMQALEESDLRLLPSHTARWLELFGGIDQVAPDDAELRLLRGWHRRLADGPGHGDDDVRAALELFHERGDVRGEARASVEYAFRGFLSGDPDPIVDSVQRSRRLLAAGADFLRPLGELTRSVIAELRGDFQIALEHSQRATAPGMRRDLIELTLRHRTTLNFLVGDGAGALRAMEDLVEFEPSEENAVLRAITRFAVADVETVVDQWDRIRYYRSGNVREDFVVSVASVFIDTCLGITPDLEAVRNISWGRPRERLQLALCEWSASVMDDDEERANERLAAAIDQLDLEKPLVFGEVTRFMVSGYVASPRVREHFSRPEIRASLGSYHLERLALAEALLAVRSGEIPDWKVYRGPAHTISSMALPWSVELACGLVQYDEERGVELVEALFNLTGARTGDWLRTLAGRDCAAAAGAETILRLMPTPPSSVTRIRTQPNLEIEQAGTVRSITRQRVRELLLILLLRPELSRDRAMSLLWPDKNLNNARNNLRITLSHLRDELEPDRQSGEPSFHVRQRGDRIVLRRSNYLEADLWKLLDALAVIDEDTMVGDRDRRGQALFVVADGWQPPLLTDLVDLVDLRPDIVALQARLRDATVAASELHLAADRNSDAERLGRKLVALDRFDERGHAILIAALLGADRLGEARRSIDVCLEMLAELGAAPSPATRMLMRRARHPHDQPRRTA